MDVFEPFEFVGADVPDLQVAHDVSVAAFPGAATVRIPLKTTDGRAGFGPSLALTYDSRAPNSVFGLGWSLSGPAPILRGTRRRLPRYDSSDAYTYADQDLVPALDAAGKRRTAVSGQQTVQFFRPRDETRPLRLERWIHIDGHVHWRIREPGGLVTILGAAADGSSRIADPEAPERIYAWWPEAQFDGFGNAIVYNYRPEDGRDIDLTDPAERSHLRAGSWPQRYLAAVRYGNTLAFGPDDPEPAKNTWLFEAVFDFGDHRGDAPTPDAVWAARGDAFSTYRCGFDLRTYRLCRRLLMFHHIDALGPGPTLVGVTDFDYDEQPAGATLVGVSHTGWRRSGERRSLPPLRLGYSTSPATLEFTPVPVVSRENAPAGLGDPATRWVDVDGDGLPGLLVETPDAWYFKANEGGGRLAAQVQLATRPTRAGSLATLADHDGDGGTDLCSFADGWAGTARRDRLSREWSGFRSFIAMPQTLGLGALAQWLDVDGDGIPEPVVTGSAGLTTYAGLGDDTYGAPGRDGYGTRDLVPLPSGAQAPPAIADAPGRGLFLVDMNGDGLPDLVQVDRGSVRYWPSLGNGRFGTQVVMDDPPDLANCTEYDPARLRFVDLDGSGTADLVYLGPKELQRWINAGGNRFVPQPTITGLPYLDRLSTVDVLNFLGDGRPCVIWSSPLASQIEPMRYLPLTGDVGPRLLVSIGNSIGGEVRIDYGSSVQHLLRDRAAGRDWHTRLPHHPVVVNRVEIIDHIGGGRAVTRYEYHDGYFDGDALAWRGFGLVDVYDADTAADHLAAPGADPTPVACRRTWRHTGAPDWSLCLGDRYSQDSHLVTLEPASFDNLSAFGQGDYEEGLRCLSGRMIREETYAVAADGSREDHPFEITQVRHLVRRLQPGVLRSDAVQTLHHRYEGQQQGPRITQSVVAQLDIYGTPLLTAEVGHGVEPVSTARRSVVASSDTLDRFEVAVPIETFEYELLGLVPPSAPVQPTDRGDPPPTALGDAIATRLRAALQQPLQADQQWPSSQGTHARIIGRHRHYYWSTDRLGPLPLGQVGTPTLHHHDEDACFTDQSIAAIGGPLAGSADATHLPGLGYLSDQSYWWSQGNTIEYSSGASFNQPTRMTRWDGAVTQIHYDPYWLEPVLHIDAADNRTSVEIDYHLLTPRVRVDPNDAVHEVRHDPLGVIVASATYGVRLGADEVTEYPYGDDPLPAAIALPQGAVTSMLADAPTVLTAAGLSGAGEVFAYDVLSWSTGGTAPRMVHAMREELTHDGRGGGAAHGRLQLLVTHFDGFGRPKQQKQLIGPGRWLVAGALVYDSKQQPVRQYQPWFATGPNIESDQQIAQAGASRRIRYDALGRIVRTDEADGTLTRTQYLPWQTIHYDHNDTVQESLYRVAREGLPDGAPEKNALRAAQAHANTPRVTYLDPFGREVRTVESTGVADRVISQQVDARGAPVKITDPRGLAALVYKRDMQGRLLHRQSIDAGDTWTLPDAAGRQVHRWDARGVHTQTDFDVLDRPTTVRVIDAVGAPRVAEAFLYGEDLTVDHATARNARGRLMRHRDQAGVLIINQYSPGGQVLQRARTLCADYTQEPDWFNPAAVVLDPTSYVSEYDLDAARRPIRQALPDGTVRKTEYHPQGGVARARLAFADGSAPELTLLESGTFNARGDRTSALLGNGALVTRSYDPETLRTNQIRTVRADGKPLQDLRYTYDPVGNVTYAVDLTQQPGTPTPMLSGATASTHADYRYDALYRLLSASGRVHQALLENDYGTEGFSSGSFRGTRHLSLNNGQAVERYTQQYTYDLADNLTHLAHQGVTRSWTSDVWISPSANRGLPARDPSGTPVSNPETRFDKAGNTLSLPNLAHLDWDDRSRITRAVIIDRAPVGQPDDAEFYTYGADGLRVRKVTQRLVDPNTHTVETAEKIYLDGCEILRTRRGGTLVVQRATSHVYDGGQRLAIVHRWLQDAMGAQTGPVPGPAGRQTIQTRYQLGNLQGSATLELSDKGAVISYEEFLPYGGSCFVAGDDLREVAIKDYRFRGAERDDLTGLYYGGHRHYAPWIGRWLSPDPIGPADTLNLYAFCINNPISYHDPDGLTAELSWPVRTAFPPSAGLSNTRGVSTETLLRQMIASLPPPARSRALNQIKTKGAELKSATGFTLTSEGEVDLTQPVPTGGVELGFHVISDKPPDSARPEKAAPAPPPAMANTLPAPEASKSSPAPPSGTPDSPDRCADEGNEADDQPIVSDSDVSASTSATGIGLDDPSTYPDPLSTTGLGLDLRPVPEEANNSDVAPSSDAADPPESDGSEGNEANNLPLVGDPSGGAPTSATGSGTDLRSRYPDPLSTTGFGLDFRSVSGEPATEGLSKPDTAEPNKVKPLNLEAFVWYSTEAKSPLKAVLKKSKEGVGQGGERMGSVGVEVEPAAELVILKGANPEGPFGAVIFATGGSVVISNVSRGGYAMALGGTEIVTQTHANTGRKTTEEELIILLEGGFGPGPQEHDTALAALAGAYQTGPTGENTGMYVGVHTGRSSVGVGFSLDFLSMLLGPFSAAQTDNPWFKGPGELPIVGP
jgi:RHS repeat-associated protein